MRKQVERSFLGRKMVCALLALLVMLPFAEMPIAFGEGESTSGAGNSLNSWVSEEVYDAYYAKGGPAFTYYKYNKDGSYDDKTSSYLPGVVNNSNGSDSKNTPVWIGGNEKSAASATNQLDSDPRDFMQILPYGSIYIDTEKVYDYMAGWKTTSSVTYDAYFFQPGTTITIRNSDFKMFGTTIKDGVEIKDGDGNDLPTYSGYKNGDAEEQKIGYVGKLTNDGSKVTEIDDNPITIRYEDAAILEDGSKADLVIDYTKISISSIYDESKRGKITGQDSNGTQYTIDGPLMLVDANMLYVDTVANYNSGTGKGTTAFTGTIRFGVEIEMSISVQKKEKDGTFTLVDGTMFWGTNDLDVSNKYGNNTGKKYSEGMTVNSGAVSYAVMPYNNNTGTVGRKNQLVATERVSGKDDGTANGIRFYSASGTQDYGTFDSGFATLVSTDGSTKLTWTGSRQSSSHLMGTTIFNTAISYTVTHDITTGELSNKDLEEDDPDYKLGDNDPDFKPNSYGKVNGGSVYIEMYDIKNPDKVSARAIDPGKRVVPAGGSTNHVIEPNDGYFCDYVIIDGVKISLLEDDNLTERLKKEGDTYQYSDDTNTIYEFTKQKDGTITFQIKNYQANHTILANFNKKVTIPVAKIWTDYNNRFKTRPSSIEFELLANGQTIGDNGKKLTLPVNESEKDSNVWKGEFTGDDLLMYKDGKEVDYTVRENTTLTVYNTDNADQKPSITESVSYSAEIVWDADVKDADKTPIKVELLADGKSMSPGKTATLLSSENAVENWKCTFSDLSMYKETKDADGNTKKEKILYSIAIRSEVTDEVAKTFKLKVTATDGSFEVENKYTALSVSVEKVWDDNKNQDGLRPDKVEIELLVDGKVMSPRKLLTLQANEKDASKNWKGTFENLPMYSNGKAINYSIRENYTLNENGVDKKNTKLEEYNKKENGTGNNQPRIEGKVTVSIVKTWENIDVSKRPASIEVELFADNASTGKKLTLQADNSDESRDWKDAFTDLDVYNGQNRIVYSIKAKTPDETDITRETEFNTTIAYEVTNKYTPKTISISVMKEWVNDSSSQHDPVTIKLMKTTDTTKDPVSAGKSITLNASGGWAGKIDNLPLYENGKKITYSVEEEGVPGNTYHVVYTGNQDRGFKVENKKLDATKVHIIIELQKRLNGYSVSGFSFGLYDTDGKVIMNGDEPVTSTTDEHGYLKAELPVNITETGDYTYVIKELTNNNLQVINDEKPVTVKFSVFKNSAGLLDNTEVEYYKDDKKLDSHMAEFTNSYSATGTAQIKAIKHISGREWLESDRFTFALRPVGDAPLRVMQNGVATDITGGVLYADATFEKKEDEHKAIFDELVFIFDDMLEYDESINDQVYKSDRIFQYELSEVIPTAAMNNKLNGITYSTEKKIITVKVHASRTEKTLKVTYLDDKGDYINILEAPDITNYYRPDPVVVTPQVKVRIVGTDETELAEWKTDSHDWSATSFTTNITRTRSTTPLPTATSTVSTLKAPLQAFGTLTFTAPGEYDYLIQQYVPYDSDPDDPVHDNLFYDNTYHSLKVIVTDDGQGQLHAKMLYDDEEIDYLTITNRPVPGAYTYIDAKKIVQGAPYIQGEFTFELDENLNQDEKALGHNHKGTNGPDGQIRFALYYNHDDLFYDKTETQKTVYYIMKEVNDGEPGWTYDTHQFHFRVTVHHDANKTDENTGKHLISIGDGDVEYSTDEVPESGDASEMEWLKYDKENPPTFTNTYEVSGSAALDAAKHIVGREWSDSDSFEFILTGKDGAPVRIKNEAKKIVAVDSVKGTATKEKYIASLGEIWFTMEDLENADGTYAEEKTYTYVIHETAAGNVTDGTFQKDGMTYAADQEITIHLTNDVINGKIRVTFGDEKTNQLIYPRFENEYEVTGTQTVAVGASKELTGRTWRNGDSFSMRLVPIRNSMGWELEDMPMPESDTMVITNASVDVSGRENAKTELFGEMTFTAPGVYEYEIEEVIPENPDSNMTYTSDKHRVTITIPDDGYGGLGEPEVVYAATESSVPSNFVNRYTAPEEEETPAPTATPKPEPAGTNDFRFTFTKVWRGEVKDIDFRLYYPDGTVYHHAFNRKKISDSEYLYEAWLSSGGDYYVIEEPLAGYSTTYANGGSHADVKDRVYNGGVITNSVIPKTGDTRNTLLWVGLLAAAGLGLAGVIIWTRRKKGRMSDTK